MQNMLLTGRNGQAAKHGVALHSTVPSIGCHGNDDDDGGDGEDGERWLGTECFTRGVLEAMHGARVTGKVARKPLTGSGVK